LSYGCADTDQTATASKMRLLDDIAARGAEIRTKLREFLERHEYTSDTRTVLVVAGVDTALEYHQAIWLLHERKLNGQPSP